MSTPLANPLSHADSAWKYALDVYFQEFMHFFYADIAAKIDWQSGYEMLDKELLALTSESMVGKRLVDQLIKVLSKEGQACFVLLHIEVQGAYETTFAQRLFEYYYKLYDRYRLPITTLVVLADDRPAWHPKNYQIEGLGYTALNFQFLTNKLLDYQGKEAALLEMANPFGTMVATHLAALATRPDANARYEQKSVLTRRLFDKGLSRDAIQNFYKFIDWILTLPEDLAVRYNDAVHQLEKEHGMYDYPLTTAERIGMKKGLQQGECALLRVQLEDIFGELPEQYQRQLAEADADTLLKWGRRIRKAQTLADVFQNH